MRDKNTKDIFLRNAIVAALNLFSDNMTIEQVENGIPKRYPVKFFYHMGSNEQLMKDFFVDYKDECHVPYAEGNYDIAPKGVIKIDDFSIKTNELTNRFVRGVHISESTDDNGTKTLDPVSARLFVLPIYINFSGELFADNYNQCFKLVQEMFRTFYKNNYVHFQFEGMRISGLISIGDSLSPDKKFEFTWEDNQKIRLTFNFIMETYMPVFDSSTNVFIGDYIREFKAVITPQMDSAADDVASKDDDLHGGYPSGIETDEKIK